MYQLPLLPTSTGLHLNPRNATRGLTTSSLAGMQRIHVMVLVLGQQPRWHTRPGGKDDKGDGVAQDQRPPDFLEGGRGKGVERVADEGDGRWDVDHGVRPRGRTCQDQLNYP
jgi:hypothetical protein